MSDHDLRFLFGPRAPLVSEPSNPAANFENSNTAPVGRDFPVNLNHTNKTPPAAFHPPPPTTLDIELILSPVHAHLLKLRATTPAALPAYTPHALRLPRRYSQRGYCPLASLSCSI